MTFPKTIKQHHDNVRSLRCVVTGNPYITLHHCHGGSMKDAGYHSGGKQRGVGEALVIPLKADFHVGDEGVDYGVGVQTWELWYGTQIDHLRDVSEQLGYDLFELHRLWQAEPPRKG